MTARREDVEMSMVRDRVSTCQRRREEMHVEHHGSDESEHLIELSNYYTVARRVPSKQENARCGDRSDGEW